MSSEKQLFLVRLFFCFVLFFVKFIFTFLLLLVFKCMQLVLVDFHHQLDERMKMDGWMISVDRLMEKSVDMK